MQQLAFWRDISLVILGMECLIVLVLLVALNYVLVRLTGNLHNLARTYARKTQAVTETVADRAEQYAATVRKPAVAAEAATTRIGATIQAFFRPGSARADESAEPVDPVVKE